MSELLEKNYEQEVFERGLAQGEAKGKAEGKAEAEAEGKAKAFRSILEKLLRHGFGEVPEAVRQRIAAADVGKLEAAIDQLLTGPALQSADELPL